MTNATDPPSNESSLAENERAYRAYGEQLREAVASSFDAWLRSRLVQVSELDINLLEENIERISEDVDRRLVELINADVDAPLSGPLERIRTAVEALGPALLALDVPAPTRDPFDVRIRPDDHYGLGPVSFADLGDEVHQAGIAWGAAKAYLHRAKRQ